MEAFKDVICCTSDSDYIKLKGEHLVLPCPYYLCRRVQIQRKTTPQQLYVYFTNMIMIE